MRLPGPEGRQTALETDRQGKWSLAFVCVCLMLPESSFALPDLVTGIAPPAVPMARYLGAAELRASAFAVSISLLASSVRPARMRTCASSW